MDGKKVNLSNEEMACALAVKLNLNPEGQWVPDRDRVWIDTYDRLWS